MALGKLPRCLGQTCFPALLRLLAAPEGQVRKHRFNLDHGSRSTQCQCDRHCTALSSHSPGSVHTPPVTRISQPACPTGFRDSSSFIKLPPSLKLTAFPRASHSPAPAGSENNFPVVSFHVWRPISPIWFPFLWIKDPHFLWPLLVDRVFQHYLSCPPLCVSLWHVSDLKSSVAAEPSPTLSQSRRITQIIVPRSYF